ncbi:hypothetical protein T09_1177 [Trichinella sp. T9]|nr:hypothetical protein T09_1177 [Trichinella sp. T9]
MPTNYRNLSDDQDFLLKSTEQPTLYYNLLFMCEKRQKVTTNSSGRRGSPKTDLDPPASTSRKLHRLSVILWAHVDLRALEFVVGFNLCSFSNPRRLSLLRALMSSNPRCSILHLHYFAAFRSLSAAALPMAISRTPVSATQRMANANRQWQLARRGERALSEAPILTTLGFRGSVATAAPAGRLIIHRRSYLRKKPLFAEQRLIPCTAWGLL